MKEDHPTVSGSGTLSVGGAVWTVSDGGGGIVSVGGDVWTVSDGGGAVWTVSVGGGVVWTVSVGGMLSVGGDDVEPVSREYSNIH